MKTYQIQIEDALFPELKRVLGFLPKDSVKLQTQAQDYQYLYDAGVAAIFGPGSSVATAGKKIMEILLEIYGE